MHVDGSGDETVMVRWSGDASPASGVLLVPSGHAEFARAVVTELDVDDEVPDTSPIAYIARIEEHLAAVWGLLEELRTRYDAGPEPRDSAQMV